MDIELPRRAVTPLSDTIDHARPIDNNLRYSSPYKSPMMPIEQPRFLDEPFGDEFMPESEMPVFPPEFLESNGVELPFENINGNYIGEESLAVQDRQSSEELSELADEEDLPNRSIAKFSFSVLCTYGFCQVECIPSQAYQEQKHERQEKSCHSKTQGASR